MTRYLLTQTHDIHKMAHNEAIDAVLSIIEGDRDSDIQIKLIKQLLVIYEPSKAKVDATPV